MCLVLQLCLTLCDPMDCSLPGSSVHRDTPGKNTGVGCHALLQGTFPTQRLNLSLLHCRQSLYHLTRQIALLLSYLTIICALTVLYAKCICKEETFHCDVQLCVQLTLTYMLVA